MINTLSATTMRPTAGLPLLGLTILLVEDSRLASAAMRLMCSRSGARLLQADSLARARRHLRVYRPGCVIVDLGLPDGSGAELLQELTQARPRIDLLLGTSGDPFAESVALAAGADAFLAKPFASLAYFQGAILALLPPERRPRGPRPACIAPLPPDPAAYRADLERAADLLNGGDTGHVAQFLGGVAATTGDRALERAAADLLPPLAGARPALTARLRDLLTERLQQAAADGARGRAQGGVQDGAVS